MFIGEEHYCAKIVEKEFKNTQTEVLRKEISTSEERSQIISTIVRITAQLAALSLSFKKFQNTRVIYLKGGIMTLSFYYYENELHVLCSFDSLPRSSFLFETNQICVLLRTIIHDIHLPLFSSIPQITHEKLFDI